MRWNRWPTPLMLIVFLMTLTGCPDDDPMISVDDQEYEEGDDLQVISVADATIDNDGFAVVYDDDDGQPGDVIGASELLEDDDHQDFEVNLDRDVQDDEMMWAILHYDALESGEFERPDKQPPVTDDDGNRVKDDFMISVDIEEPVPDELSLVIDDQTLPEDDPTMITVSQAVIDDDGFVVIYDEEDEDEFGEVIGASDLLEEGMHTDFMIDLDQEVEDGETLWGRLHYDDTEEGEFIDDDEQRPALDDDDQEVTDSFVVTLDDEVDPPPVDESTLSISDQTLDWADGDLSTIVTVDEVDAQDAGWVAIHAGDCTELGNILGFTAVDVGESSDLSVELNRPAASEGGDDELCGVLHVDEDDDNVFDPAVDEPALDADGEPVADNFVVDVVEGTAAIRVTLGSETPPRYTVEQIEPVLFIEEFETDDDDVVEMELRRDWRYEFNNTVAGEDPFEFANDEEEGLLSQEFDAPLEDVESINWVEDGDVFRFTVSEDFSEDTGVVDNDDLDGDEAVSLYQSGARPNLTGPVMYLLD